MFTVELPSGLKVSINPPSFNDRMNAVKEFRAISKDAGFILEELMAAKSIAAVDGNVVEQEWASDPIMVMAEWSNIDVQYFIEYFMTAFFPDDKLKEKAQEEAKKLMRGQPSPSKQPRKATT